MLSETPLGGEVELWSMTGQGVQQHRYVTGRNELSTTGLVQGMYILKLRSGEQYSSKKVVVTAP